MLRTFTTIALTTVLAGPAMAQQQGQPANAQTQGNSQQQAAPAAQAGGRSNQQPTRQQALSGEARDCLDQLEQVDRRLAEVGYGRAGPAGYGVPGGPYGRAAPATGTAGTTTAAPGGFMAGASTPRGDMQVLMRAGYVMAMNGYGGGCQAVAEAAKGLGDRYAQAMESGAIDAGELRTWRGEFLTSATRVTQLDRAMSADEIIGADVRNMRDEDLGDIDDVVFGADGKPRYVIVSTEGFLGLGEDQVPVPWQNLRVTAEPYRDTFVLDVAEQTLEDAPRLKGAAPAGLASGKGGQKFDQYWKQAIGRDKG